MPNPFSVFTPEGLTAQEVVSIFYPEMPGLGSIQNGGHAFIIGARGSGKSILFRYHEPDCQRLETGKALADLPYVSLYVSFRETQAQISELARFSDRHGEVFFNEHLLVLAIGAQIVLRLLRNNPIDDGPLPSTGYDQYREVLGLLTGVEPEDVTIGTNEALRTVAITLQKQYRKAIQFVKRHGFKTEILPYTDDLFGFDDLLLPLVDLVRAALVIPDATPVLLLLDDADSLTLTQTRIVNSWVARRLHTRCSLKVAAQITAYKSMLTVYDTRIEAPHDYHEINLSDPTSKASEKAYVSRIAGIVQRRLRSIGLIKAADKFFEEDNLQRLAIEREAKRITSEWGEHGRGHRARDDAYRYARPNYITSLGGTRKSRSSYSYSGFDQLVHISSGVTRFFLEAAADMYDKAEEAAPRGSKVVTFIAPHIQNDVVREHASRQMIGDLKDLQKDVERLKGDPQQAIQLTNLINGLGALFESALIDNSLSERKLFSFALTDDATPSIEDVLALGIRYGYFFQGIIGRKEGTGRAPLYILSRRLAPLFNLDPMGFSGYKFLPARTIEMLMNEPEKARLSLRRTRSRLDHNQMTIDFDDGGNDA
jgi:hypothetical protein